jgi:two-component system, chemotaxis family, sensor kinase CheA
MQDEDLIREFLGESRENLSRLDQELVELEKHPKDQALLASVFRAFHTIKGTCGFLAFSKLERITHQAESLLSQLRDGQRELSPDLISLLLETIDATRAILSAIEASGREGPEPFADLTERLRAAARKTDGGRKPAGTEAAHTSETPPAPAMAAGEAPGPPTLQPTEAVPSTATGPPGATSQPLAPNQAVTQAAIQAGVQNDTPGTDSAEANHGENGAAKHGTAADVNIRVGVVLLDKLMDLVGELVLTRNQILQFNAEREDAALNATSQQLNLITTELQEGVMKTRMQPIGMVWNKLPRVVRDMAVTLGKQISLETDGAETELDRTIIEAIKDPLVHLVRNACDHGIEFPEARVRAGKAPQGKLALRAYHAGGQVNIEISDDGKGIDVARVKQKALARGLLRPEQCERLSDREAWNLVFHPGFSTAETVTNVSGRGVGMDVVKSSVEKIGGVADISSRPGEGTTIKLKIPLTLAIIPGLVVALDDHRSRPRQGSPDAGQQFVIPQVSLVKLVRLEGEEAQRSIERVLGTAIYRMRGELMPIVYLREVLGQEPASEVSPVINIAILQAEDRQFGLVVDSIKDTQEIVVKPLGKQLKGLTMYAGATIMGDGRVALILDVLGIGQRAGVLAESRGEPARAAAQRNGHAGPEQERLLLFRAGSFERLAVPLSLVARLEEFPRHSIEQAGGRQVVQYRDRILPLISLRGVLEPLSGPGSAGVTGEAARAGSAEAADPLPVIVFHDGSHSIGVAVDQILDVVEDVVTVRQKSGRPGLLGSAVVGKRVTDFLDLNYVLRGAGEDWFEGAVEAAHPARILVAEASAFSRGLIRSGLDMAGYRVVEAANFDEVIRSLEQHPVELVVAALDLPPQGSTAVLAAMRRKPEWQNIPILALAETPEQARSEAGRNPSGGDLEFQDCQMKFDRAGMLQSVARLAAALGAAGGAAADTREAGAGEAGAEAVGAGLARGGPARAEEER